jgi:hypothetical protein
LSHHGKQFGRRILLGLALGAAFAQRRIKTGHPGFDHKVRRMIWPLLFLQDIGRRTFSSRLTPFLQPGLGIAAVGGGIGELIGPPALDERARRVHAAVEINRRDHRLQRTAQDRTLAAPAGCFRAGQHQMVP